MSHPGVASYLLAAVVLVVLVATTPSSPSSSIFVAAYAPLSGVTATSIRTGESVDLGRTFLGPPTSPAAPSQNLWTNLVGDKEPTADTTTTTNNNNNNNNNNNKPASSPQNLALLIIGTYAADFNAIEYVQRLRYYLPQLQSLGVAKFGIVLNCHEGAARCLMEQVDLDMGQVEVFVDPLGQVGKELGVGRGWLPDVESVNPYLKLFGMLWGLGAWATLPAVIGGYIGNPLRAQPWMQDALAVGQRKGRWPNTALELSESTDTIVKNKFDDLPLVGSWKRRPLELATLRLQSMLGISLDKWQELAPTTESLEAGVLTQLGACVVVDTATQQAVFEWKDPGICAVANFEDIVETLQKTAVE